MANHGVFTSLRDTSVVPVNTAASGIPFVIGIAPLDSAPAATRAAALTPVLCTSMDEVEAKLGYSDNFSAFSLSRFAFYWFTLCSLTPAIFLPLPFSLGGYEGTATADQTVFSLTSAGANPSRVTSVKVNGKEVSGWTYDPSTGDLTFSTAPGNGKTVHADHITTSAPAAIAAAVEKVDLCMASFGIVPDLLLAPDYDDALVAAAMAAKAGAINGIFKARTIVDIEAASYTEAITAKNGGSYSEEEIVCWPCGKVGDKLFNMSIIQAARIALTDADNQGVPYESPSNKPVPIDRLCDSSGGEILLTLGQANLLNAAGIVTGLNFMGGYRAWGNYTGAWPGETDVVKTFIPVARMFDWVGNTVTRTFWAKVDKPMNRRLVDSVIDSANIWLNGLVGRGYLLGARVEMLDSENPLTDLMAGICRLHIFMTPPSPAQEIDFILEYDASYVESAFA